MVIQDLGGYEILPKSRNTSERNNWMILPNLVFSLMIGVVATGVRFYI
jgi:hypothetical protein